MDRLLPLYAKSGYTLLVVGRRSDAASLGICGFVHREDLDAPALGFGFLERDYRHGCGFESAPAVMIHGRRDLSLKKIYGLTTAENVGSLRLLQKLKFRIEAHEQFPPVGHPSLGLINEPVSHHPHVLDSV